MTAKEELKKVPATGGGETTEKLRASVEDHPELPADPLLKELYNSTRPSVQLVKGIGLAPIVCAVWPAADSQVCESVGTLSSLLFGIGSPL